MNLEKNHRKLERYEHADLYERLERARDSHPKYVARLRYEGGRRPTVSTEGSIQDLKILVDEYSDANFGPGVLSGYGFRGDKPKTFHRGIRIGEYIYREHSMHLPRFAAMIDPPKGMPIWVHGRTVEEVKSKIDENALYTGREFILT